MDRKPEPRLESWKEIAGYLKRGTRTVQRWESEEGLPVHRLVHEKLGSVYAYRSELDAWWSSRGASLAAETPSEPESGPSIAVLPLTDMSQAKDQAYFCEGMAEEIIHALGRIHELRVASRTSSFRFHTPAADLRQLGQALRVRHVLEGSVRKSGERLRIAVRVVDAQSGFQLWSEQFDRAAADVLNIQNEIAGNVARTLQLTLTRAEKSALERPRTRDVTAYDLYLRGRDYFYRYSPKGIELARRSFARAVEIDPDYADAHAGLADCWSYIYLYSDRSDTVRDQAGAYSRRALELDPESAQAHASLAFSLSLVGHTEEARTAFETALRLDPGLFEARYFYARHCFVLGELEKAVALYEGAHRVRPDDYQSPLLMAQIYDDLGRPDDAAAARRCGIALAERHLEIHPDDPRARYMAANGLVALGELERGKKAAEQALACCPTDAMLLYNVGCVYSMLGMVEPALDCLERAAGAGITQKGWYERDSNLDPLRSHPRFQRLLQTL
jgi:adenylate cyclase